MQTSRKAWAASKARFKGNFASRGVDDCASLGSMFSSWSSEPPSSLSYSLGTSFSSWPPSCGTSLTTLLIFSSTPSLTSGSMIANSSHSELEILHNTLYYLVTDELLGYPILSPSWGEKIFLFLLLEFNGRMDWFYDFRCITVFSLIYKRSIVKAQSLYN